MANELSSGSEVGTLGLAAEEEKPLISSVKSERKSRTTRKIMVQRGGQGKDKKAGGYG